MNQTSGVPKPQRPQDVSQHSLMLKLSIAAIIRRIEFDTEALTQLIGAIPSSHIREGLVEFDKDLQAAVDKMKQVKT